MWPFKRKDAVDLISKSPVNLLSMSKLCYENRVKILLEFEIMIGKEGPVLVYLPHPLLSDDGSKVDEVERKAAIEAINQFWKDRGIFVEWVLQTSSSE